LRSEGIHAGLRGDRLRISPHLYTDDSDLARLAAALSRHARRQE
jgi:selenocysteine lyase/cysteine desulfurase